MISADCTVYIPDIGTHSFIVSPPLERMQCIFCIYSQWLQLSLWRSTKCPSLLGGERQHGMSNLPDTSTYDHQWDLNPRPFNIVQCPFFVWLYVPIWVELIWKKIIVNCSLVIKSYCSSDIGSCMLPLVMAGENVSTWHKWLFSSRNLAWNHANGPAHLVWMLKHNARKPRALLGLWWLTREEVWSGNSSITYLENKVNVYKKF